MTPEHLIAIASLATFALGTMVWQVRRDLRRVSRLRSLEAPEDDTDGDQGVRPSTQ